MVGLEQPAPGSALGHIPKSEFHACYGREFLPDLVEAYRHCLLELAFLSRGFLGPHLPTEIPHRNHYV